MTPYHGRPGSRVRLNHHEPDCTADCRDCLRDEAHGRGGITVEEAAESIAALAAAMACRHDRRVIRDDRGRLTTAPCRKCGA